MKTEYDFQKMKSRANPYADRLKSKVMIPLPEDVLHYFQAMTNDTGLPYETLISLYLRDCMIHERKPDFRWSDNSKNG